MPATTASRQERKLLTRAALRDAARACFAELGYDATGIGDITRKAGVAAGTFYVHFAGKEDLVDDLLGEFNDAFAGRIAPLLRDAAAGALPLEDVVRAAAGEMLDHWREHRGFIECYVHRSASAVSVASLRDGVNPPMAGLLREALERAAGDRPGFNAELVTHALLGMWLRVGLQFLFNRKVSRKDAIETLVQLTVGATAAVLGAAPAPRR